MNTPFDVVDISSWEGYEELEIYPEGSREKNLLVSSSNSSIPLKSNHLYLFKQSSRRYLYQFWMEIIAYHLGNFIGINVPITIPAIRRKDNSIFYGAIIEWFLDLTPSGYIEPIRQGSTWMKAVHGNEYDPKGKRHNFEDIRIICSLFSKKKQLSGWKEYWVKTLFFDSLIGNTDRHPDNWGIIYKYNINDKSYNIPKLTPVYDNGTSLGHEIIEKNIYKFDKEEYLEKYIIKGQHHMKWNRHSDFSKVRGESHLNMIKLLCKEFGDAKIWIEKILPDETIFKKLEKILSSYSKMETFPPQYSLSEARINLIMRLLYKRCFLIKKILREA